MKQDAKRIATWWMLWNDLNWPDHDNMEKIRRRGGRVGCFPVSANAWTDMGEWEEYLKRIQVR